MRSLSVRAKLTLWYLAVTSVALLLFGVCSYATLRYALIHVKRATLLRREQHLLLYLNENKSRLGFTPLDVQLRNYALIAHEGNLVQIRDRAGKLIFPADAADFSASFSARQECASPKFADTLLEGQPGTVMCHDALLEGQPVRFYVGGALDEDLYILGIYRNGFLVLLPCLIGLGAVGGYYLSGKAMLPVDRMTKAAVGMGIGNLSARLPLPAARDELWSLAIAWNQLLERLESAVNRLSKFSADASHDLRTSITVILATAQISLHRSRSEAEYRDNLERIVNECRTASTLLDALLSLARSDNFIHEVAFQRMHAGNLVLAACRRVEDLAESAGILLDWSLPEGDLFIKGDELLLQRLLGILLDNAIKYTPEHGEIRAEVRRVGAQVAVTVRDTGIGMSEGVRQHIFDRFYQGDLRERKNEAGNGLGLAIARWIAEAHHAELTVESAPMKGSTFCVLFPAADADVTSVTVLRAENAGGVSQAV